MVASGPIIQQAMTRVRRSFPYFTDDMLRLKDRSKRTVIPRQYMWYLLRLYGRSYPWIARNTGGWDHTTIMWGVKAHVRAMQNPESSLYKTGVRLQNTTGLLEEIERLEREIKQLSDTAEDMQRQRLALIYQLNDLREKAYGLSSEEPSRRQTHEGVDRAHAPSHKPKG